MPLTNLVVLQEKAEEILKAEVAALLQNFGKVSSKFIAHYALDKPAGHDYDLKRVAAPAATVNLILGQTEITSFQGVGLINALANASIWGSLQSLSQSLGASVTGTSTSTKSTAGKVRTSSSSLVTAGANSADASLIRNRLISALYLAELFQTNPVSAYGELDAKDHDGAQQQFLNQTKINTLNAEASFSELLLLMWDSLHGDPNDQQRDAVLEFWTGRNAALQRYLVTCHGVISNIEKETPAATTAQPLGNTMIATAFGWEKPRNTIHLLRLDASRDRWLKAILRQTPKFLPMAPTAILQKARGQALKRSEAVLRKALGETQRANNDVTLWDYVSTIATLFKSSVAKALLENRFVETSELKWRLLSIRYDGLEYLSRAHHISDLLARRDALEAALDEVKAVIEVEYPLGNEIYRDENGSVLLVPHIQHGGDDGVLALDYKEGATLRELLAQRFSGDLAQWTETRATSKDSNERPPLDGEIKPLVALSSELLGKQIKLPVAKNWHHPQLQADAEKVGEWWSDPQQHGDVCTVCGLRPQGYGATGEKGWKLHLEERHQSKKQPQDCEVCKAIDRQVCWVCLERRDERSQEWAQTALSDFQKTIWVDEVADNNGRVALVVGRFGLDGWLDGSLIPTMQKSDSFARIQRCWRTTETFWQEVERALPQILGSKFRPRLKIEPQAIIFQPPADSFGRFHTYELEIAGAHLSVVWNPNESAGKDKGYFITCENLDYFQRVAAIKGYDDLKQRLAAGKVNVYEPSAHLSRRKKLSDFTVTATGLTLVEPPPVETQTEESEPSSPFIRILAKPALFMVLVPADKALNVASAIKTKYETEMGKVRDRLPLHVGVVFAPHRTPMRALLEAGRRMLEMPDRWEFWTVQANNFNGASHNVAFEGRSTWQVSAVMGDGSTEDQWYPHLMLREPLPGEDFTKLLSTDLKPWKRLKELQPGDQVYVRPSRFDFEFLDVSARRNEISYTHQCKRRGSVTRPFLLEDLDKLNDLWNWLIKSDKPLTTSHLQHLEATLTSYITEWFDGDLGNAKPDELEVFKKLSADVLRRLDGGWWKKLKKEQQDLLIEAVGNGRMLDLLELRMHILKEKSEELPKQQEDAI